MNIFKRVMSAATQVMQPKPALEQPNQPGSLAARLFQAGAARSQQVVNAPPVSTQRLSLPAMMQRTKALKQHEADKAAFAAAAPEREAAAAAAKANFDALAAKDSRDNMAMNTTRDLKIENAPMVVSGADPVQVSVDSDLKRKRAGSGISSQLGINV